MSAWPLLAWVSARHSRSRAILGARRAMASRRSPGRHRTHWGCTSHRISRRQWVERGACCSSFSIAPLINTPAGTRTWNGWMDAMNWQSPATLVRCTCAVTPRSTGSEGTDMYYRDYTTRYCDWWALALRRRPQVMDTQWVTWQGTDMPNRIRSWNRPDSGSGPTGLHCWTTTVRDFVVKVRP